MALVPTHSFLDILHFPSPALWSRFVFCWKEMTCVHIFYFRGNFYADMTLISLLWVFGTYAIHRLELMNFHYDLIVL